VSKTQHLRFWAGVLEVFQGEPSPPGHPQGLIPCE